jgi:hypothetical protein
MLILIFFPLQPSEGEEIDFVENATCYDITNSAIPCPTTDAECPNGPIDTCYQWDIDYIAPFVADLNGTTTKHTFSDNNAHIVAFEITDKDGSTVRTVKIISPKQPFPQFKETAPTSMIKRAKEIFVGIFSVFI